jgi:hypothetical protein
LGGLETKKCLEFLVNKDLRSSFSLLLVYYDKLYQKALEQKQAILKTYVFVDIDDLGKKDLQSIEQSIKGLV